MAEPVPVLLVGSLPLADREAVFRTTAELLGDRLQRFPDGETGPRSNWIAWQRDVFARVPALVPTAAKERIYQLFAPFSLRPGLRGEDVVFGPLGFAAEALASYAVFRRLKGEGRIAAAARLQVALPTPFAPVYSFTDYRSQQAVYPRYEAAMLRELDAILAAVPAAELSVQWDVSTEMSIWEEVYPVPFDDPRTVLVDRLARLGDAVPRDAELAYHLCYGSMNNRHWKEPADTARLVEVANRLAERVARPLAWLHLPVPVARTDDAYFAPLAGLRAEAEIYLGLLHLEDGVAGAVSRARAARRHLPRFGIATECGLGRRPPESIPGWMALHREAATALSQ